MIKLSYQELPHEIKEIMNEIANMDEDSNEWNKYYAKIIEARNIEYVGILIAIKSQSNHFWYDKFIVNSWIGVMQLFERFTKNAQLAMSPLILGLNND